jgi:hypothetical protein
MKAQHAAALEMAQEQAFFDELRRQVDQRHHMCLIVARPLGIQVDASNTATSEPSGS